MIQVVGRPLPRILLILLFLGCPAFGFSAMALAALNVSVDRTEITDADLLKLTIRLDNSTSASNPNFSAIERDFDIVQRSGPNQSSRISIINGRQTSEVNVTWELRLRPKRTGTLTIPAFRLGSNTSAPIRVQVNQQSEAMKRKMSQLVFFDTSVDTNQTYVQGQILYTIKLYYVENISGDFPPMPSIPDAVVEVIEGEKRYDAITNGRRYYVLEKRYGIYPQKSGELVIPAQNFSGYRVGPGFFSTREPVLARSEAHRVNIQPKPASFPGSHWLPAASLTADAQWLSSPQFTVGEPINRSIEIRAEGVAASLLPKLAALNIDGAKTYQDPPVEEQEITNNGIISKQTVVIGIVPTKPGRLTLPEISIPWWNTQTNQLETAVIASETFDVAPSPQAAVVAPVTQPSTQESAAISPNLQVADPKWQYATIGLFVLWIITLVAWFFTSRRGQHQTQGAIQSKHGHSAQTTSAHKKDFTAACQSGNGALAQRHLIAWANAELGEVRSLQDLHYRVDDEALSNAIDQLESQLYSPSASGKWEGKGLLAAAAAINGASTAKANKPSSTGGLTPSLNPS